MMTLTSLTRSALGTAVCCVLVLASAHAQQSSSNLTKKSEATPAVTPAVTPAAVTTTGGTANYLPKFSGSSTVVNSVVYDNGTDVGIGIVPNGNAKLDVNGPMIMRGNMTVSRTGNATTAKGYPSYGFDFYSNVYRSSDKVALNPFFQLQSEPTGNNTATIGSTLNFLYSVGGGTPVETGLYINKDGTLHFAPAQAFPITTGATGPQGPQGPTGATGATGPQGPSGSLALPYAGSGAGNGKPAFQATNTSTYGTTAPYTPDGIAGYGGSSGTASYSTAGTGIIGNGGNAANTSANNTFGGVGVVGRGGTGNPSHNGSSGGYGGEFYGGDGGGGTNSFGGDGIVTYGGSPNGLGLYVYSADDNTANTAAIFIGAVDIYGALYKSSGAFKIDHPVDPANKYLVHSFVESPDMMNIYNGNVVTDGSGEAVVILPDYFEALNRDFRYQLTTVGSFSRAMVASEIRNGRFVIRTEQGNVKVSWQVTGVRQDAWANAHRLPNEVEKTEKERGHFIHPELFGHAGEQSINEVLHTSSRTRALAPQE